MRLLPLTHSSTGDLACNQGMCPDWESNQQAFGLWDATQPTEPHQSELLGHSYQEKYTCKILPFSVLLTSYLYILPVSNLNS